MQAGTPTHSGDAQSAVSACGQGHPRTQAALSLPSPRAGGDARAPRLACGRGRPPTQAALSLPSPHAGGDARAPRLACGRGRPRTQDAYGSIILHIALNAQSPSARRHEAYTGSNSQSSLAPRQALLSAIGYRLFLCPAASSPIGYRLSAIPQPHGHNVRHIQ